MCRGRFQRRVVACMHNCPQGGGQHCRRFWDFFKGIGQTPVEYYNEDGIGEQVMRRIVFDCDRCGKRDVNPTYSRYRPDGESEEHLLDEPERVAVLAEHGYESRAAERSVFDLLQVFEEEKTWQHFCPRCFTTILDSVGKLLQERPPTRDPQQKGSAESKGKGDSAEAVAAAAAEEAAASAAAAGAPRLPAKRNRRAARAS